MQVDSQLIESCKKRERYAQKVLYESFAPLMRAICLRYAHTVSDAEDLLHEGFIKVFTNIWQYSGKGSFEGWIKRIFINLSITHFHKRQRQNLFHNIDDISEISLYRSGNEDGSVETDTGIKSVILSTDF